MSGFIAVAHFLLGLFFSLALLLLWARMFLRFFKISPLHSVSQLVNSFTDPFVKTLERFIPTNKAHRSRYDWACFAVIVLTEIVKFVLFGLLLNKTFLLLTYLFLFIVVDLIVEPCNLLFYLILLRVIMSWVKPDWHHPVADVMKKITDPILALGRHLIPDISGFDFSPFIILIILKVITLFMEASLPVGLV